jgi:hypothetical protein
MASPNWIATNAPPRTDWIRGCIGAPELDVWMEMLVVKGRGVKGTLTDWYGTTVAHSAAKTLAVYENLMRAYILLGLLDTIMLFSSSVPA